MAAGVSEPLLDRRPSPAVEELSEWTDGDGHRDVWLPDSPRGKAPVVVARAAAASRDSRSRRSAAALLSTYWAAN